MAMTELQEKVKSKIEKDFKIDFGGHLRIWDKDFQGRLRSDVFRNIILRELSFFWGFFLPQEKLEEILAGCPVHLNHVSLPCFMSHCGECGMPLKAELKEDTVFIRGPEGKSCPHPNGMPAYDFEISVPSGKLVVANDLRRYFKKPKWKDEEELLELSCNFGMKQESLAWASQGMAHAFVGNTCPSVYQVRKKPGKYIIAVDAYTEDDEMLEPRGIWLADICTDLWWYSLADESLLKSRKYRGKDPVIEVPPGTYRFTHRFHLCDEGRTKPQTYTTFELVKP